ncbi:tumor necrosis factor ligand superfamily member 15 isoform X2 [Pleurodeles waltl]|uniref:tumor necrosis factor ligand superfamily member 15 isoform X2 n=1 Tax=Pleurodeles waltl TaxID=8319 RepID=UPI00370985F8
MEGGVQTMLQEERGLMQQAEENLHTKGGRKALLAAACCLFTICILGLPTAYLLTRNSDAAKQSASTIQIQNRSLQPSGHQTRGVNHPQKDKPRAHLTGMMAGPEVAYIGIWVFGHSFMKWAQRQAGRTVKGENLGFDVERYHVRWISKGGMRWEELLPRLQRSAGVTVRMFCVCIWVKTIWWSKQGWIL